jgi:hypothetical protein
VLLIAFRLLAGRPATTTMEHRGGRDNGDAPSWWLRRGRCRGRPGARGAGASAEVRGPGRPRLGLGCRPPGSAAREPRPWGSWGVGGPGGRPAASGGPAVTPAAAPAPRPRCGHRGAAPPSVPGGTRGTRERGLWHTVYPRTWAVAHGVPKNVGCGTPLPSGSAAAGPGWHQAHRLGRKALDPSRVPGRAPPRIPYSRLELLRGQN